MNLKIIFVLLISGSFLLNAQEVETKKTELTGSLYADSKIILKQYNQLPLIKINDDVVSRKSPVLAGLLSAAVPGAGQFYNEDYWKAAIFVALEGALITSAVIYNNKGKSITSFSTLCRETSHIKHLQVFVPSCPIRSSLVQNHRT